MDFNENAYKDLGYTKDEFCKLTITDFVAEGSNNPSTDLIVIMDKDLNISRVNSAYAN